MILRFVWDKDAKFAFDLIEEIREKIAPIADQTRREPRVIVVALSSPDAHAGAACVHFTFLFLLAVAADRFRHT